MQLLEIKKGLQLKHKQDSCRIQIRKKIIDRSYGQILPGLKDLAEEHGVNLKTIRKSINPLIEEGLLVARKGSGIFVVGKTHHAIGIVAGYDQKTFFSEGYTRRVFEHVVREIDNRRDCFSYQRKNERQSYEDLFKNNKMVDGLLIFAPRTSEQIFLTQFRNRSKIPFVLVGTTHTARGINFVDTDNAADSRDAVTLLIRRGHTRIAFVSNEPVSPAHELRLLGYRNALEENRLSFDSSLVIADEPHSETFRREIRHAFESASIPTAIFAANITALEKAAHLLKDSRRENLAVIAYDDIDFALRRAFREYGAIIQPHANVGKTAIQTLYHLMETSADTPVQMKLRSEIVFPLQEAPDQKGTR